MKRRSTIAEGEADARAAYSVVIRPSICSFGGAPFAVQMGQAANRVVCDVAENMNWTGWATMDQALRVLTGNPPVAENDRSHGARAGPHLCQRGGRRERQAVRRCGNNDAVIVLRFLPGHDAAELCPVLSPAEPIPTLTLRRARPAGAQRHRARAGRG